MIAIRTITMKGWAEGEKIQFRILAINTPGTITWKLFRKTRTVFPNGKKTAWIRMDPKTVDTPMPIRKYIEDNAWNITF